MTEPFFTPIEYLAPVPFVQNFRGTVYHKADIMKSGSKCGFSVGVTDGFGSTILCLFFSQAAEKFDEILQVNDTYTFSGGILRRYYESEALQMHFYFDEHCVIEHEINIIEDNTDID
jgi:hypothetical protein